MKKVILFFFIISSVAFGQLNITKYLTDADSILNFTCQQEWIEITVVDSANADTVWFEVPSITTGYYIPVTVRDLTSSAYVTSMIPGTGLAGKKYQVWAFWIRGGRLRMSDVNTPGVKVRVEGKP